MRLIRFLAKGCELPVYGKQIDNTTAELIEGDIFGDYTLSGKEVEIGKLLAPVVPPLILAIGLNFADLQFKDVHAGHLFAARIFPKHVLLQDLKTGNMDIEIAVDGLEESVLHEDQPFAWNSGEAIERRREGFLAHGDDPQGGALGIDGAVPARFACNRTYGPSRSLECGREPATDLAHTDDEEFAIRHVGESSTG